MGRPVQSSPPGALGGDVRACGDERDERPGRLVRRRPRAGGSAGFVVRAEHEGPKVFVVARSGVAVEAVSNHWYRSSVCASAYRRK